MKYLKIIVLLNLILIFYSCGTVKKGFINQKKNSTDEFLVEKKSPLVMPPDYNELPTPKQNENQSVLDKNKIESLISNNDNKSMVIDNSENNSDNVEQSILKKIKKN